MPVQVHRREHSLYKYYKGIECKDYKLSKSRKAIINLNNYECYMNTC